MRFPFVRRKKYDEVVYKLEALLCHATGGKLSKSTYTLQTMESVVTDYIQESCDEASIEGGKTTAEEIFAEIDKLILRLYNDVWYTVPVMGCDVEMIKKKYTEEQI